MSVAPVSNSAELLLLRQLLQDVELNQFEKKIVEELQVGIILMVKVMKTVGV